MKQQEEQTHSVTLNEQAEIEAAQYNRFAVACGIQIQRITGEYARGMVEVHDEIRNAFGNLHGGLLFTLADAVAGMTARMDGRRYVTQSSSFEFLANVSEGRVYGTGRATHRGQKVVVVEVRVTDENERLLAVGFFNMIPVVRPALRPDGIIETVSD